MTGLKSGSGDDLWGDEGDEGEQGDERKDGSDGSAATGESAPEENSTRPAEMPSEAQPYIVRRAIEGKPVQFERDERLTFFVHEDVTDGERELVTELQSALGRDVPKFDVREAVYRAALRNRDDVLDELVKMGYSVDTE